MAARNIYVYENGRKIRNTASETIDFLSIKVGASALEIKESATATGHFDLGAVRLTNVADPVNAQDAATKKYTTDTFIPLTQRGAALGVATLDGGGKVPVAQLPSAIMEYVGVWNATTNSPTLADFADEATAGDKVGDVYRVSVAGSQNLGSGAISFEIGDYVICNRSGKWEKSDTTDAVASVNGKFGVVVLTADDVLEAAVTPTNLYFTEARAKAAAVADAIVDGVTDVAPSQNAVYDALALKANDSVVVKSVNGVSPTAGAVTLTTSDIAQGTNLYFTDAAAKAAVVVDNLDNDPVLTDMSPSVNAVVIALAGKADVAGDYETLVNDNAGSITAGQIVYVKSNGHVDLAKADALATCGGKLGIVMETIATTASGKIHLVEGKAASYFSGLTIGVMYFLSAATAGAITTTAPSAVNSCIVGLGKTSTAAKLVFNPEEAIEILS